MNNPLIYSSWLFILPPILLENIQPYLITSLLLSNTLFSCLFWYDSLPNTLYHLIDGVLGKLSMVVTAMYMLFFKSNSTKIEKFIFLLCFFNSLVLFYFSDYYSSMAWLSNYHIICHLLFHICISMGICVVYV
jgi:hypothetical protein